MPLRIGFLGGVPPALGGGGLEVQIERTATALSALGHEVVRAERAPRGATWDVLHAFGAEGNVQFFLEHWTRARAPLVISPVLVTSPGRSELALQAAGRWSVPATHAALRRRTLLRADLLVALTGYERRVLRRLVGRRARIEVVPNGAERVSPASPQLARGDYALLVGAVSERKRQREAVEALAGSGPVVVVGGFAGTGAELARWEETVRRTGARWLGRVDDPAEVARLTAGAAALVHLSAAEGQSLAVLDALAHGTPVVVSDIPSHAELAESHPGWVHVVGGPEEVPAVMARLRAAPPPARRAEVPGWDDVAARLVALYGQLATRPS